MRMTRAFIPFVALLLVVGSAGAFDKSCCDFREHFSAAARTATATGTAVDMSATADAAGPLVAVLSIGTVSGTAPTLDVKFQDSADNTTFADVTGAAFAQKTAAGFDQMNVASYRRYVRAVATIGGTTPSFTFSLVVFVEKKTK